VSRGSSQAHTRHRKGGFDLIAPLYDVTARVVFGGQLMAAQRALLPHLCEARRALMIGGGTGELLALALRRAPQLRVCYVEASAEMIKRAQARLSAEERERVAWCHSTHVCLYERSLSELWGELEGELEGELSFDCVLTCFMLDVLSPQEAREVKQIVVGESASTIPRVI
jgi:tRNA (cmo5U34)-methyltransferase